jgi:hypothetical protein
MFEVNEWARRHGVSQHALVELLQILAMPPAPARTESARSEAACQTEIRLAAPEVAGVLWRNNVGSYTDDTGVPVRYGLANDSKRLNTKVKSSDLIGVLRFTVGPHHVGRTLGVFTAIECKRADWMWRGTPSERAQQRFLNIVSTAGGVAGFARDRSEFFAIVSRCEAPSNDTP